MLVEAPILFSLEDLDAQCSGADRPEAQSDSEPSWVLEVEESVGSIGAHDCERLAVTQHKPRQCFAHRRQALFLQLLLLQLATIRSLSPFVLAKIVQPPLPSRSCATRPATAGQGRYWVLYSDFALSGTTGGPERRETLRRDEHVHI